MKTKLINITVEGGNKNRRAMALGRISDIIRITGKPFDKFAIVDENKSNRGLVTLTLRVSNEDAATFAEYQNILAECSNN